MTIPKNNVIRGQLGANAAIQNGQPTAERTGIYHTTTILPSAPPKGLDLPKDQSLELYIEYEFVPKALMTQFIVSRHTDIDRGRTLVWRHGVVLRRRDALAEVVKTKSQGRDAFYNPVAGD